MMRKAGFVALIVGLVVAVALPGLPGTTAPLVQARQDDIPVCATNGVQLLGTDWEVEGGVWGLKTSNGNVPDPANIINYGTVAAQFTTIQSSGVITPAKPVVIFIIDDFDGSSIEPKEGLPHGEYVIYVARELLKAFDTAQSLEWEEMIPGITTSIPPADENKILLAKIDVTDMNHRFYPAEEMVQAIQNVLGQYDNNQYDHFVLNMSFVLIPCKYKDYDFDDFIRDFPKGPDEYEEEIHGPYNLLRYIMTQRTADPNDTPTSDDKKELYKWAINWEGANLLNPLRDYIQTTPNSYFWIGAAGNLGDVEIDLDEDGRPDLIDPLIPSKWPEVISVGATMADGSNYTTLAEFSNLAAVKAPGAWYQHFHGPDPDPTKPKDDEYMAGTSYAAPAASVLFALMLATDEVECDFAAQKIDKLSQDYFIDTVWNSNKMTSACHD